MADRTGAPQAPLAHGDDKEHRRQIAQRANQALPKSGSEPMLGDLNMGGFTILNDGGSPWITPAFNAANFTGNGSMTWTVESGDVATYAYIISGKTMTVSLFINTTTVGGTPDNTLQVAIPASKVATKAMASATSRLLDNNVVRAGIMQVLASGTVIQVLRDDAAAFTASTNQTGFRGQLTFEIN
jgi:hypothetical protein